MPRKTSGSSALKNPADRKPVVRDAHEVIMVGHAQDAGDEGETDDHVEPLLQYFPVHTREPDQKVGQERTLNHFPDPLDPQMHRPPAIEDAHGVVVEGEEGREIEQGGQNQPGDQHSLRRGPAARPPDGEQEIGEKHQHHHHDKELEREGLLEELVAFGPAEHIADHDSRAHEHPKAKRDVGEPWTPELGARLLGHDMVRCTHKAGEDPHDEQIGVDGLHPVKWQQIDQRIGAEVFHRGKQAKGDLEPEEQQGDGEVRVGHSLRAVAHARILYGRVER